MPLGKKIIPVFITDELIDKIKYLCKSMPRDEWSGILFYEPEGSIKDPDTFKIHLKDVFLMDKGNATFTSYEFDEIFVGYMMDNQLMGMQIGHMHSHNTMRTYFSGTDEDEVVENSPNHNYYLSVIVNNFLDFEIRVGFLSTAKTFVSNDEDGNEYEIPEVGRIQTVFYYNCQIQLKEEPVKVPDSFKQRMLTIFEQAEKKIKKFNEKFDSKFNGSKALPAKGSEDPVEDYFETVDELIIELLGQNTPIILKGPEVSDAMESLAKEITIEEMSEYIASTLNDYHSVYKRFFGNNVTNEAYLEDLTVVIETIEEHNNELKSMLFNNLTASLKIYADEFSKMTAE